MIDIQSETLLSLTDATKALPRIDGKRPHISTLWRWCRKGLRGVRLEYVRVGHRVCTSQAALSRFTNNLAAADDTPEARPLSIPISNDNTRAASISRAELILARAGI